MKRIGALREMRGLMLVLVGLLGSVVIAPTVCPAENSDRFSFPLPLSLEVGDRWIYSIVKIHWEDFWRADTLSTETLTIRVVERLPIEDQTYFALSDGGLYRVDEARRTWRYDTEAKSETIVWDIWRPLKYEIEETPLETRLYPWIEKPVVNGYACGNRCFARYGPFVRHVVPAPEYLEHLGFEELDRWIATIDTDIGPYDFALEPFLSSVPLTISYADILKYPDWGIVELYLFGDTPSNSADRGSTTICVAPNVGVVYYEFTEAFYSAFDDEWMNPADSTGAGKVGLDASGPLDYIEKTAWILQGVQKGDPGNTVVEDTSWGQLKQRMRRPVPNAP